MGGIGSPETSVTNNQPTKPNIPEERRPGNDRFLYFIFVFKYQMKVSDETTEQVITKEY